MHALLALVAASVGLQLISAFLVKTASTIAHPELTLITGMLLIVLILNFGRFLIWNNIHKKYPVSLAYPLSAIFFPAIVLIAWAMGERIGLMQLFGATLVMIGVARIVTTKDYNRNEPHFPLSD